MDRVPAVGLVIALGSTTVSVGLLLSVDLLLSVGLLLSLGLLLVGSLLSLVLLSVRVIAVGRFIP